MIEHLRTSYNMTTLKPVWARYPSLPRTAGSWSYVVGQASFPTYGKITKIRRHRRQGDSSVRDHHHGQKGDRVVD